MFIKALKGMMIAMVLNVALTPWGTSLAKYAGYAAIILTLLAAILGNRGKSQIELNKGTVAIFVLFVATCIGMIVDITELKPNVDFFKVIICFFSSYILINTKPQIHSQKDLLDIFRINKLLSWVYIAYTFLPFSFRYTVVNYWGDTAFTMNMGNSNATSILVMFCITLRCLEFKQEKKLFFKIVEAVAAIALMYTLVLLKSRTAVASMLLVIACIWFKKIRIRKWYGIVVLLVPLLYFVVQIWLKELEGIVILGKEINTGRGELFTERWQEIKDAPVRYIVGSVVEHNFINYHNAPMSIVSNFGVIGLIAYLMFWRHQFQTLSEDSEQTPLQALAVIVLFAFLVHSSAEASPMLGAIPYSSAIVLIARLAKDRFEEPEDVGDTLCVISPNPA